MNPYFLYTLAAIAAGAGVFFIVSNKTIRADIAMKYFTISELCKSNTATSRGIDNTPTQSIVSNLTNLVTKILDPLREQYGKPITVNSGYRSPRLNEAVGGSSTSQHVYGQAADITGGSVTENKKLFNLIVSMGLPFDQLINENNYKWVHVSYSGKNRRQKLALVNGKYYNIA